MTAAIITRQTSADWDAPRPSPHPEDKTFHFEVGSVFTISCDLQLGQGAHPERIVWGTQEVTGNGPPGPGLDLIYEALDAGIGTSAKMRAKGPGRFILTATADGGSYFRAMITIVPRVAKTVVAGFRVEAVEAPPDEPEPRGMPQLQPESPLPPEPRLYANTRRYGD